MFYLTTYNSQIGLLSLVAKSDDALFGLWIENQKYFMPNLSASDAKREDNLPIFIKTKSWLDRYFSGQQPSINELTLEPFGSSFRMSVWSALCKIPYKEVTTYGQLARQMGERMSSRAVGGAISKNPISIIIPCHRVISANGFLGGYAGGLEKKLHLLKLEGIDISNLKTHK